MLEMLVGFSRRGVCWCVKPSAFEGVRLGFSQCWYLLVCKRSTFLGEMLVGFYHREVCRYERWMCVSMFALIAEARLKYYYESKRIGRKLRTCCRRRRIYNRCLRTVLCGAVSQDSNQAPQVAHLASTVGHGVQFRSQL